MFVQKKWIFISLALIFIAWIAIQTPTQEGEWHPLQTRLPHVEVDADDYILSNIRDFRYDKDGTPLSTEYMTQHFALDQLTGVWLGLSHFATYGFAHAFLSFEFSNPEEADESTFLVVSVEARLRPDQRYSPMKGLFQQYQRINILGTEEDIIGLRSHVRGERVYLYELTLPEEQQVYLFQSLMQETQSLNEQPAFYNTLLHNCVTSLLKHDPDYRFSRHMFDYRVLLPGYGDEFAQEKGWISQDIFIDQLREKGLISPLVEPEKSGFSKRIRAGR